MHQESLQYSASGWRLSNNDTRLNLANTHAAERDQIKSIMVGPNTLHNYGANLLLKPTIHTTCVLSAKYLCSGDALELYTSNFNGSPDLHTVLCPFA